MGRTYGGSPCPKVKDFHQDECGQWTGRLWRRWRVGRTARETIGQAIADFVALKMSRHVLGDLSAVRIQTKSTITQNTTIISNASCTTNCLAPVAKVIQR